MLFMNRPQSFLVSKNFVVWILKTKEESRFLGFLCNPPLEETLNSMEQKTRVFCQIDVQEFHLRRAKPTRPKRQDTEKLKKTLTLNNRCNISSWVWPSNPRHPPRTWTSGSGTSSPAAPGSTCTWRYQCSVSGFHDPDPDSEGYFWIRIQSGSGSRPRAGFLIKNRHISLLKPLHRTFSPQKTLQTWNFFNFEF
jgi:hypothetical protein